MQNMILVTGGAGFIGSNFVLQQMRNSTISLLNLDKLTHAGNLQNLESISANPRYQFIHGDIGDRGLVRQLLEKQQPSAIVHFAAESHVDRSIRRPDDFIPTNVDGTFALLEETRAYWTELPEKQRKAFRFLHVSTDEVYGSLGLDDPPFSETTPYAPNSPYAASKAGSDHLVRAYYHTYGLPTLTTNCSNNYGPFQFPEKLIPLMILMRAIASRFRFMAMARMCGTGFTWKIIATPLPLFCIAVNLARPTTSAAGTRRRTSRLWRHLRAYG